MLEQPTMERCLEISREYLDQGRRGIWVLPTDTHDTWSPIIAVGLPNLFTGRSTRKPTGDIKFFAVFNWYVVDGKVKPLR
jgi:hypothetical protein